MMFVSRIASSALTNPGDTGLRVEVVVEVRVDHGPQAVARLRDVVGADVDAVDRGEAPQDSVLESLAAAVAAGVTNASLRRKDLLQEVAEPAGGLQERAVRVAWIGLAREHVRNQVEHRVDLALVRVDLGEVADPRSRLDLRALRWSPL